MSLEILELCDLKDVLSQVSRLEDRIQEETGLSLNEAMVVCTLSSLCLSPGDLAPELRVSPSRATRITQSLIRKGLVESHQAINSDQRRKSLALTEPGLALAEKLHGLQSQIFPFSLTKEV